MSYELKLEAASNRIKQDILDCLMPAVGAGTGVRPKLLARELGEIFRGKDGAKAEDSGKPYVGPKKVRQMSNRQLVEAYDPTENNEVCKRLLEISKGQPFVVFNGRSVLVEATLALLEELKQGYPPREFYEVGGIPQEVQSLGFIPDNEADENPLYKDRPLRPDGTCDQTNRSWAGVSQEVKQFLRVGVNMGTIKISKIEDAHYFMDLVMNQTDPMKFLRQRYAAVSVQFDKLAKENKLPRLKIELALPKAPKAQKEGRTSPFDGGKVVQWVVPPAVGANYYRSREVWRDQDSWGK